MYIYICNTHISGSSLSTLVLHDLHFIWAVLMSSQRAKHLLSTDWSYIDWLIDLIYRLRGVYFIYIYIYLYTIYSLHSLFGRSLLMNDFCNYFALVFEIFFVIFLIYFLILLYLFLNKNYFLHIFLIFFFCFIHNKCFYHLLL